jgi:PAS domain S-box-containing protein
MTARDNRNATLRTPYQRSGDSFRSIVEHTTDVVTRVGRDGRHLYVNPAAESLLGLTMADVVGRTCREVAGEIVADTLEPQLAHVFESGHDAAVEVEVPRADKMPDWYHLRFVPEWDTHGNVETVLMLGRDITERKVAERQLQESEDASRWTRARSTTALYDARVPHADAPRIGRPTSAAGGAMAIAATAAMPSVPTPAAVLMPTQ